MKLSIDLGGTHVRIAQVENGIRYRLLVHRSKMLLRFSIYYLSLLKE